jgi:hypothetical protein
VSPHRHCRSTSFDTGPSSDISYGEMVVVTNIQPGMLGKSRTKS